MDQAGSIPDKAIMSTWSHPDDADMARAYVVVGGRILECEADDFLEGREFYELMQAYRHDAVGDAAQFEKVKAWLRAGGARDSGAQPVAQTRGTAGRCKRADVIAQRSGV